MRLQGERSLFAGERPKIVVKEPARGTVDLVELGKLFWEREESCEDRLIEGRTACDRAAFPEWICLLFYEREESIKLTTRREARPFCDLLKGLVEFSQRRSDVSGDEGPLKVLCESYCTHPWGL